MVYRSHTKCWENAANARKMESIDERTAINNYCALANFAKAG